MVHIHKSANNDSFFFWGGVYIVYFQKKGIIKNLSQQVLSGIAGID